MRETDNTPEATETETKAADAPKKGKSKKAELPESVTLAAPYGYIGDDDLNHFWQAGDVVTDAADIADLVARKAPLVGLSDEE